MRQVFSPNLDGSGVVWVIHQEFYEESWSPFWSPDGTLIAAAMADGLWIFTAACERVRRLSRDRAPASSRSGLSGAEAPLTLASRGG